MPECQHSPGNYYCHRPVFEGPPTSTEQFHDCYTGMSNAWNYGQLSIGCGVGCPQCRDDPWRMIADAGGDMMGGRRWLSPNPAGTTRDAYGYYQDVVADRPHPVPRNSSWVRGTCRDNYGIECFGTHVCSCWGGNKEASTIPPAPGSLCQPGDIPAGQPVHGLYNEDFLSVGMEWPVYPNSEDSLGMNGMYCRKFQNSYPEQPDHAINLIANGRDGMLEPLVVRSFYLDGAAVFGGCHSNWLIPCAGRVAGGPAVCNGYSVRNPEAVWYNEDARRGRYNILRLADWSPRIAYVGETLTESVLHDRATRELKNTILEYVGANEIGGTRFDQIDYDHFRSSGNGQLNQWSRRWQAARPDAGHAIPDILGECHLRDSGHPVTVTPRIHLVRVLAIIMLHHLRQHQMPHAYKEWCVPLVRFKITIGLYWEAHLPSPCALTRSWLPENHPDRTVDLRVEYDEEAAVPNVVPADAIIYKDKGGREIIPFELIEWKGWLGSRSRPSAYAQRTNIEMTGTAGEVCNRVYESLNGIVIPGWPYAADSAPEEPSTVYQGRIVLGIV